VPDRRLLTLERIAVWTVTAAVCVAFLVAFAIQSPAFSFLGIGSDASPTCAPPETELSDRWATWTPQEELPFGLYDPVIFVEPEREYPYRILVAPPDGQMDLYKSKDMEEFVKVADAVESAAFASNFNWGRKVDGRYYLFRTLREEQTELWTGPSLQNLTNRGVVLDDADTGGFYDPETETWHIYYQKDTGARTEGDQFGPNSDTFGHATSKDALHWTEQPVALNVSDEPWKVGDPDVLRIDDRYYMFFDQTSRHPNYYIHMAVSENLSRFEPVGRVTTTCGGDAKVRYLPTREEFVMLTEFGGDDLAGIGVSTSPGPGNGSYRLDGRQDVIVTTDGNETESAVSARRVPPLGLDRGAYVRPQAGVDARVSTNRGPPRPAD
jgi:hypothetical protein